MRTLASMLRPLSTVALPVTAQTVLKENGFLFCEDVINHRGVTPEARSILQKWNLHSNESWRKLTSPPTSISNCLDIWQEESTRPKIVTWSKELDAVLGGGVPLQSFTELCGAPGSGKTQMSLQLCVDVQIPQDLGGVDGESVYIDTGSNFTPQRVRDMAEACSKHCQLLYKTSGRDYHGRFKDFNSDKIMSGIHVVSVHGIAHLLAALKLLPQLLKQHSRIKLIVIDNLAFSFNCGEVCTTIDRTSYIYRIMSDLQELASNNNLAVVVTNQLTTRLIKTSGSKCDVSPALGESMGHRVNQRLLLGHVHGSVMAAISLKGNNQGSASAKFRITEAGIRDV